MPIVTNWFDEQENILIHYYPEKWTGLDSKSADSTVRNLCGQKDERFDIIVDLTQVGYTLPIGTLYRWANIVIARDMDMPNWGLTVFVTTSPVHRAYFDSGISTTEAIRKHYQYANTIIDAVQLIMTDRQSKNSETLSN